MNTYFKLYEREIPEHGIVSSPKNKNVTGRLAQLVERRTREHNVSGLYRCGFESPAGQLKLLIVFRMRR